MYNTAIIGAGQLGSRHLQGLKTSSLDMNIWVLDSSEESLKIAQERYEQVKPVSVKSIYYANNLNKLPNNLDFVVIATGSKPRASIIRALLDHSTVKNLILEKVLFPTIEDYDNIAALLQSKNVNCWVNCPRRMFGYWNFVKERINPNEEITMVQEGVNWGLCCNALHYIDIFLYITGEKTCTIDTSGLIPQMIESKRSGYIEFNGTLKVKTTKGCELTLISHPIGDANSCIEIKNGMQYFGIYEPKQIMVVNGRNISFHLPYQSELTGLLADIVLKTGFCPLCTFEQSSAYHKTFIKVLLDYYNEVNNTNNTLLPIT